MKAKKTEESCRLCQEQIDIGCHMAFDHLSIAKRIKNCRTIEEAYQMLLWDAHVILSGATFMDSSWEKKSGFYSANREVIDQLKDLK